MVQQQRAVFGRSSATPQSSLLWLMRWMAEYQCMARWRQLLIGCWLCLSVLEKSDQALCVEVAFHQDAVVLQGLCIAFERKSASDDYIARFLGIVWEYQDSTVRNFVHYLDHTISVSSGVVFGVLQVVKGTLGLVTAMLQRSPRKVVSLASWSIFWWIAVTIILIYIVKNCLRCCLQSSVPFPSIPQTLSCSFLKLDWTIFQEILFHVLDWLTQSYLLPS